MLMLLQQISTYRFSPVYPFVAAVGEHSDSGKPIVLENTTSALAFVHLTHEVIEAVERRNNDLPPTHKVELH